jgi:hypothetical protein
MVLLDNVQIVASNKRTFSIGKYAFNIVRLGYNNNTIVIHFSKSCKELLSSTSLRANFKNLIW